VARGPDRPRAPPLPRQTAPAQGFCSGLRFSISFLRTTRLKTSNSTRRFCWRPIAVLLSAIGRLSPEPFTKNWLAFKAGNCVKRSFFPASAPASDSFWFAAAAPRESVWPRTSI